MLGFGVTAKVRDAVIRLESNGLSAEKTDLGVVPLINFKFERRLGNRATFLLEGDALAAPRAAPRTSSRASSSTPAGTGRSKPATASSKAAPTTTRSTPSRLVHYVAAGVVFRF